MRAISLSITIVFFFTFLSCNAQSIKNEVKTSSSTSSDKIEAYYFHFTARCTTCKTIEANTKANLESLYPNQVKQGLITFQSLNLDEESTRPLAQRLGVTGQTLLFVKGEVKINLTNEGFMYAVVKPDKFKEIINEKVDGLMIK
jgi:hypothetical protein